MSSLTLFERLLVAAHRRVGHYVPSALKRQLAKWLLGNRPPLRFLNIDVVGTCNLRCPSCPVGNMGPVNPSGLMAPELYERIVRKARDEHRVVAVGLFNWTEPLLHPQLPELVRITKRLGLDCHLSSNLNVLRNIDDVLAAGPDYFRISLSGYTQATYGTTHARGDIERVKENMRLLSEARRRAKGSRTRIEVYYHKYRDNLHELPAMRGYARLLGFDWMEHWAYYMPLEKVLELVDGKASPETVEFVDSKIALPIVEAVEAARVNEGHERCSLLSNQLTIDHRGSLNLCCAVYDLNKNRLGDFLSMSESDIQQAVQGHTTCQRCAQAGVHRYVTYADSPQLSEVYNQLAERRATDEFAENILLHARRELPLVGDVKVHSANSDD